MVESEISNGRHFDKSQIHQLQSKIKKGETKPAYRNFQTIYQPDSHGL